MKINTQYTDLIEWLGQRFNRHSVAIAAPAMSCLFSKGQEDAPADDSQVAAVKVVGFWLWIFGKGSNEIHQVQQISEMRNFLRSRYYCEQWKNR